MEALSNYHLMAMNVMEMKGIKQNNILISKIMESIAKNKNPHSKNIMPSDKFTVDYGLNPQITSNKVEIFCEFSC